MKPAPFRYARPEGLEETLGLLAEHGDEAKVIAGGQSLGPLLNLRLAGPALLVDVNRLPLAEVTDDGGVLELGALTRQRDAERDPAVARAAPLLAEALPWVGHVAIRNRGTVGGSLAHADPAAELPAVAVALGAELVARSARGRRTIAAEAFFAGPLLTSLRPDELLTHVRIPRAPERSGSCWVELARRHGDFALAGAAATLTIDAEGRIADAAVALAGVGATPVSARAAVEPLRGLTPDERTFAEAAELAAQACRPPSDLHASSAYRRRVAAVLVRRALARAYHRARER